MTPVLTIVRALTRASRRELGTYRSLKVNNIFLLIALMVGAAISSGVEPKSAEFLILLLGLLLLFPLSGDPLALIPESRRALWPLTRGERWSLRAVSIAASPMLWFALLVLVLAKRPALGLLLLGSTLVAMVARWLFGLLPRVNLLRLVPQFPGRLGGVVRNDLREMLSVLDPYFALVIATGGTIYRLTAEHRDPRAMPVLAMLVGLTLSTYAQCLFGLDRSGSAMTRYRLLPVRGWEILFAKDVAYMVVLTVLVLPLDPITGWTFGLTSLAVGHWPSVWMPSRIYRWRFTGSRLFPGVVQGVLSLMLAFNGYWHVAALLYVGSLALAGRAALLRNKEAHV